MSIREPIELDALPYIKGLNEANAATVKYARKQEKLWKQNKKDIQAIEATLKQLKRSRDASNNPKAVQKYTNTIEKLEKQQRELRKETEKYEKSVKKTSKESQSAFKRIGKSAKLWLVGAVASAALAVTSALRQMFNEALSFDQKMRESLAIMGDVSEDTQREMARTAREVASELNISATKAAESYFFLASAGLSARQSIAALPAVAEFSRAGMFDMATATDIATDAQSALGLTVDDSVQNLKNLRRVTDVLVNANQDANASVQQFGEALTNRAGTALRNVNKDLEEGVGILATYADQGIKGARAGELFSRFLRITSRAAAQNKEQFQEMGIMTPDEELASLTEIVRGLTQELEGLTGPQQTARLEQLGFTAEVQEAIKPLLGLTEQVDEYTQSAYKAAGATEEVANNQMVALKNRVGELWEGFKNTFGPSFISLLETAVSGLEEVSDAVKEVFDSIAQSQTDEMIEMLERIGGSEELISRLKVQQTITNAEEVRKELEAELGELTVPASIDEKGFIDSISGVLGPGVFEISFGSKEQWDRLKRMRKGIQTAFDDFKLSDEAFDMGQLDQYESTLDESRKSFEQLSNTITAMKEEGGTVPEELMSQVRLYEEQISKLQSAIDKARQLQAVEESIQELRTGSVGTSGSSGEDENSTVPTDEEIKKAKDWIATLKEFGDTQERLSILSSLGMQQAGGARLGDTLRLVTELDNRLSNLKEGDVIGAQMRGATENVRMYNEALTRANNELNAGIITQEQYEQRIKKATDTFLGQVQEIYKTIKDQLSPAQQEMFEDLFGNFEVAAEGGDEFKSNLDDIADTADAILNVADAFGAIGDNARKSLRGISDVLRNVQQIKDLQDAGKLTALSGAMPAIGVAGGLLSMASGLFGGSDQEQKLISQLDSLERQIRRNTEALREQALVGAGISQQQIDSVKGMRDELRKLLGNIEDSSWGDRPELIQRVADVLDRMADSGIEALEGFNTNIFSSLWAERGNELSQVDDVLRHMLDGPEGLNYVIQQLTGNLGQFGDSLEGATARFEMTTQLGMDPAEAFDTFIQDVIGLVGGNNEVTKLLEQIAEAESPEGRKELANQLWEAFQDNPALLGADLTGSDLQEIIDMILGQEGASGSDSEGISRSVQVARTITDVQANEMIMFLERIETWTRATAQQLGDDTALSIALPSAVADTQGGISDVIQNVNRSLSKSISIGDVNMSSDISEDDIDNLMRQISRRLKQELRGGQF